MREFQGRRLFRLVLHSRPVLFLLVVIILWMGWSVFKLYRQEQATNLERQALLGELARLESRRIELESEIELLSTKRGQEEEIREKLGLALPGEGVITVITPESTTTSQETEEKGWFGRLINYLSGLL